MCSSDSNLRPFTTAKSLQNYPFSQNNYRPDSSTTIYFQSPEQAARWQHLDLPSFGIDAGHEIRSQAQPDYSVAPWTSRADFHTPPQSFLSQHYSAPPRTARNEVWSQFQPPHCPYAPGPATVDTPSVALARPESRKRGAFSLFYALAPSKRPDRA